MSTDKCLDKEPDVKNEDHLEDIENTEQITESSRRKIEALLNSDEKDDHIALESADDGQSLQEEKTDRLPSSMIANVSEELQLSDLAGSTSKENELPPIIIRSIGSIEVSVLPKEGVFELIDIVFGSPVLLLLHVYHVKHELKFLNHMADDAAIHVSLSQGSDCYDMTIEKGGLKTEYPIVRDLCLRLGYLPSANRKDIVRIDCFLSLASIWSQQLDEHLLLLTNLTIENCDERIYNPLVESYLQRRRSFYTELNTYHEIRFNMSDESIHMPNPWQVIALLLLYRDGLIREKALSLAKEIYYEAWSTLGGGFVTDWFRRLHSLWSKDYLLEFESLLKLHKAVMENDTINEWYQEHNTMSKEGSNDPIAVMMFHESMMDGTAMINRILSKRVELPISEPSAATSPAREGRPSRKGCDLDGSPIIWKNHRDSMYSSIRDSEDIDFNIMSPLSDYGREDPIQFKDGPSRHSRSFEAKEDRLKTIREDSFTGASNGGQSGVAGAVISRRSPVNQSLCLDPKISNYEKKTNNFLC